MIFALQSLSQNRSFLLSCILFCLIAVVAALFKSYRHSNRHPCCKLLPDLLRTYHRTDPYSTVSTDTVHSQTHTDPFNAGTGLMLGQGKMCTCMLSCCKVCRPGRGTRQVNLTSDSRAAGPAFPLLLELHHCNPTSRPPIVLFRLLRPNSSSRIPPVSGVGVSVQAPNERLFQFGASS
jgi:hypothetical protein